MAQFLLVLVVALTVGAVVFGVSVLVTGADQGLGAAEPDGRAVPLPGTRPLVEEDVQRVRFDVALRGYRMAQVDQAMRRAAYDIGYKDELIGVLEAEVEALRAGRTADADVLRRAREAALQAASEAAAEVTAAEVTAPDATVEVGAAKPMEEPVAAPVTKRADAVPAAEVAAVTGAVTGAAPAAEPVVVETVTLPDESPERREETAGAAEGLPVEAAIAEGAEPVVTEEPEPVEPAAGAAADAGAAGMAAAGVGSGGAEAPEAEVIGVEIGEGEAGEIEDGGAAGEDAAARADEETDTGDGRENGDRPAGRSPREASAEQTGAPAAGSR